MGVDSFLMLCSTPSSAYYGAPPCGPDEKVLKFMGGAICSKPCGGSNPSCPAASAPSPAQPACGVCGDAGGSEGFGGEACEGGGQTCHPDTLAACPVHMSCEKDG